MTAGTARPVGGYFVWPGEIETPVQLIAGGSGVVPFLAMLGQHRAVGSAVPVRLLCSARTLPEVVGRAELQQSQAAVEVTLTLTRGAPAGWGGPTGRVDAALLARHTVPAAQRPPVLTCGPTPFVETVAVALIDLGHDPSSIRTERFGATGGSP